MLAQLLMFCVSVTEETLLLFWYSAKRKGDGRELCSDIEEEAYGGGKAAQSSCSTAQGLPHGPYH
jgi:hypothetical protein